MSLSFSLVCDELKLKVWVGQGHHYDTVPVMTVLYSGESETMDELKRFLNRTRGKPLRFVVDDYPASEPTHAYSRVMV